MPTSNNLFHIDATPTLFFSVPPTPETSSNRTPEGAIVPIGGGRSVAIVTVESNHWTTAYTSQLLILRQPASYKTG